MTIHLFDEASDTPIGVLTDAQFQFVQSHLVSEGIEDTDYYVNRDTLDTWEQEGGDPALIAMLRKAMADRPDMDIRWEQD